MANFKLPRRTRTDSVGTAENTSTGGVSLFGESGRQVAMNIRNLALGKVAIEDLGPGYSYSPDGTIQLRIASVSLSNLAD